MHVSYENNYNIHNYNYWTECEAPPNFAHDYKFKQHHTPYSEVLNMSSHNRVGEVARVLRGFEITKLKISLKFIDCSIKYFTICGLGRAHGGCRVGHGPPPAGPG